MKIMWGFSIFVKLISLVFMLNLNNNVGFLFDLDGVIIDSENEYTNIWTIIEQEFPTGEENFPNKIKGTTLSNILSTYYFDDNTRKAVEKRLHELENQMSYKYCPHAEEFLVDLKKHGLPCSLVTSSDDEKMKTLFCQHPELKGYFDCIVTGNLVKYSKPSPEGYLLAASKIIVPPENCVVFEDSLQGVMAGIDAGCYVVGVCGTLPKEILAPYSHALIENFSEINLDNLIHTLQLR